MLICCLSMTDLYGGFTVEVINMTNYWKFSIALKDKAHFVGHRYCSIFLEKKQGCPLTPIIKMTPNVSIRYEGVVFVFIPSLKSWELLTNLLNIRTFIITCLQAAMQQVAYCQCIDLVANVYLIV